MKFPKAPARGGEYEQAPADTHAARCYQVIDLGIQEQPNSQYGPKHQLRFTWELVDCPMKDQRNFSISRNLTYSMGSKARLRAMLESWRGQPFTDEEADNWTPESVLGAPCLVQVQHGTNAQGGTYAYVSAVTKPPKGMKIAPLTNETLCYSPDFHDQATWDKLTPWLQKKINGRLDAYEIKDPESPAPAGFVDDNLDDEVPF